ncbi:MAG: ATP-dependent sacrificial sulfur transferase LarE, partial [Planctomycetota bacterium]
MISTAHEKLSSMQHIIRDMRRVAVAFSGGVDSAFVLKVAAETLGSEQVLAITSCSASVPRAELEQARKLADDLGVRHVFIETDEFSNEDYLSNPVNRCYFCKTTLYTAMMPVMREHGIENMVNGTNSDDLGDYRPGLQAAREHGVRAPAA